MIDKKLLQEWETQHWRRIFKHLEERGLSLDLENISSIIEATSFEVMRREHPDYCPVYYRQGLSCHPQVKDLSCFLCACPNYDCSKDGGGCNINSRKGKMYKNQVWDCSDCSAYHSASSVRTYIERNLQKLKKLASRLLTP